MEQTLTPPAAPAPRIRVDGWTSEIQSAFIEALARSGCVRLAAQEVGRSRASAYRLRARGDAHAFRAAWDASLGLAYDRLREVAMDRIQNGLEQRTFDADGNLVARRIVHNDRLLMFLLDHHKPRSLISEAPDDAFAAALVALDAAPAGAGIAPPVERNGYRTGLSDDDLVDAVRHRSVGYVEAFTAVPGLKERFLELWDDPIFNPLGEDGEDDENAGES